MDLRHLLACTFIIGVARINVSPIREGWFQWACEVKVVATSDIWFSMVTATGHLLNLLQITVQLRTTPDDFRFYLPSSSSAFLHFCSC